ncbi:2,3-bisphosphoglycerate-dependent phosphoglycerate mutase [Labrenzia sp. EL_126]|nr:2,3-bisphosphoglycerate-dependent phosphoglycerate mutase [Labrenzia sp. EL_126]
MTDRFAILVRHAAYHQKPGTPSALQPFGLTDAGKEQAMAAGREVAALAQSQKWRLAGEIFCSRQLRAWQTATLLSHSLSDATGVDLRITEDEALAERSVGALANLTIPEIERTLQEDPRYPIPPENWKADSHYRLPVQGAESLLEAGTRVADFLKNRLSVLNNLADANAQIFVGHGASLRHAAHHLGVLGFEDIRRLSMHHARPVVLKRAQDKTWHHHTGAWKERSLLENTTD